MNVLPGSDIESPSSATKPQAGGSQDGGETS